ncbi:MAG TPA: SRPBCC family protein [Acidimicrobiales bacterium]|nr:SRPBCC family protein [Acidimicrobiales bacterium]
MSQPLRAAKSRMRISPAAEARVHINSAPAVVWDVVVDVTLQDRWSGEATKCYWIEPAEGAAVGACFRGHNRRGFRRWTRTNEVMAIEPGRTLVWRTLSSKLYPDSTEWCIEVRPEGTGTTVRESYRITHLPRALEIFLYWFNPDHRDRRNDLEQDLLKLKTYVETLCASSAARRPEQIVAE